jgi:flagellar hook-basal body complex protein FliE
MELTGIRANPLPSAAAVNAASQNAGSKGAADVAGMFGSMLEQAISNLEQQEKNVRALNEGFVTGQGVDVHTLMIASEKAQLGLQLTVQVRNKVIEAYQEIMRTQL